MDSTDGDMSGPGRGYGILKVVDPGVVYCSPPLVEGLVPWEATPGGRGRSFAMRWSEDELPRYRCLLDFHAGLAARRAGLSTGDEELKQFDA
ncbi:MAG: hypothetical protein ACK55I_04725, partial [bacterium]